MTLPIIIIMFMQQIKLDKIKSLKNLLCIGFSLLIFVCCGDYIPLTYKNFLYTISCLIKDVLILFLPFLMFPFIALSFIQKKNKGAYLVFLILLAVFLSNFTSIVLSYFVGISVIPLLSIKNTLPAIQTDLIITPLYQLHLPKIISIPQTIIFGIITGMILSKFPVKSGLIIIDKFQKFSLAFFEKVFINILPIYIIGIILKSTQEIEFSSLVFIFGELLLVIISILTTYICFLFVLGQNGSVLTAMKAMKNSLPAFFVGFSTMSSLVTMPITMRCAEKNTVDHNMTKITITTTVNCHDIGDCIIFSLVGLAIIYITYGNLPTLTSYLKFACTVSIIQFSAVSVPGGSLAVMLPIFISNFGFTDVMSSLLIALYVFLEPIGTAGNVMGNSAFVILIEKLYIAFKNRVLVKKEVINIC
jgi:Na+/H+-dicarboxylate symporter